MKITQKQAKQDALALLQKSVGQVVEASHPVFEVLMKHPRAQEKLFTANGKLRHIMVRRDASIIIDGVENFSINKCVFKIADWRDWDTTRRVKNACRTTVKEWIFAWKGKQANLQCFHCQCALDSDWECDHTVKFCKIVDNWLKNQQTPETKPNAKNSLAQEFRYMFADAAVADDFYKYHAERAGADLVASCKACNRARG